MNKSTANATNGKHAAADGLLSKEEVARIVRKAARLTPVEAELLVVPRGTSKRPVQKPAGKPSFNVKLMRHAMAKLKAERELLLSYYRQLHATKP
jgi:hypothetical protein